MIVIMLHFLIASPERVLQEAATTDSAASATV